MKRIVLWSLFGLGLMAAGASAQFTADPTGYVAPDRAPDRSRYIYFSYTPRFASVRALTRLFGGETIYFHRVLYQLRDHARYMRSNRVYRLRGWGWRGGLSSDTSWTPRSWARDGWDDTGWWDNRVGRVGAGQPGWGGRRDSGYNGGAVGPGFGMGDY